MPVTTGERTSSVTKIGELCASITMIPQYNLEHAEAQCIRDVAAQIMQAHAVNPRTAKVSFYYYPHDNGMLGIRITIVVHTVPCRVIVVDSILVNNPEDDNEDGESWKS